MKKFLATILFTLASVAAFGQGGYFSMDAPGSRNTRAWSGGVFYACTTSQSLAACVASPGLTIYSDVALASSITQTNGVAIPFGGGIKFYAQPGTYALAFVYSQSPASSFLKTIVVPPDVAANVALNDGYITVPAPGSCFEAASTNAGTADGTVIIDGATPAVKGILSASGAANVVFTCQLALPTRLTTSKGTIIQDITFNYAVVTNTLDSWAATLKSFTAPASGASQTPASATLATFGGTLTLSSFTNNGAVSAAGSYYSQKITLGTPAVLADHQVLVLQLTGAHAAATAITVTVPTVTIHYTIANM